MIGRLGVRLASGLALLALVAGVPAMLAAAIGWPLPSQPPSWDEVTVVLTSAPTERLVMNTLAVIAWVVWAAFVASLASEVVALARHGLTDRRAQPTSRNPGRGLTLLLFTALATGSVGHSTATAVAAYGQPAAAVEVVTEIGPGATVTETAGQPAPAPASSPQPTPGVGYLWEAPPPVLAAEHGADTIAVEVAGQRHQVPVAADATLWDLAEMVLGDVRRWPQIRDLNPGCYPGGAGAGQVLLLPADAITPAASPVDRTSDANGDDEQDPAVELTYQVAGGDWMWHIAGRYLGDEERFGEIAALNPQLARQYEDYPDHIQPGDELVLPDDARDRGPRPHATGHADGEQAQPPAELETPEPAATPPPSESPASPPEPSPPPATTSPAPPATGSPTPVEPSAATPGDATPAEQPEPPAAVPDDPDDPPGVVLPSGSWISFGLAALVAALAVVLRLNRRRRARLTFPIPPAPATVQAPLPETLQPAEAAGRPQLTLDADADSDLAGIMPGPPSPTAALGVDQRGEPLGLFALPGEIIYLHGVGAVPAARAALAAACATGVTVHPLARPQVVTTGETLAQLLPPNAPIRGLDPDGQTFDGEHLHIAPGPAEAIELAEQEMVSRWRHLDQNDAETVAVLNARDDAEPLPPFLLLLDTPGRHWPRLSTLATSRASLGIHVMVLNQPGGVPGLLVQTDGTVSHEDADQPDETIAAAGRLSTLTADELADLLDLVRQAQPHPEPEPEPASDPPGVVASAGGPAPLAVEIPHPSGEQEPPVRLSVLGPVTLATAAGPVTSGVRARGYAVLALLAAHPAGRTLEQLAEDLHHAGEGVQDMRAALRADINSVRATLRKATGITGKFLLQVGGRYRIDPDLIDVDLWRMLAHIDAANHATDDDADCLAALQAACDYYQGDFATGQDMPVFLDHATGYRHQILSAYGKIAEIVELDNPDQAVTVLEAAAELDPVNEELHQRIMRIHGRAGRPEQVRRTLSRLEARLAEMGHAEPSAATRRVAARQLAATPTDAGQSLQPVPAPAGRPQR